MEETKIHSPSDLEQPLPPEDNRPIQQDAEVKRALDSIRSLSAAIDAEILCDEQGPIPSFPIRRALDEHGRFIHPSPEELRARSDAYQRIMKVRREQPDDEPPGLDEEIMRGIDSHRPEGMKLFEGYY